MLCFGLQDQIQTLISLALFQHKNLFCSAEHFSLLHVFFIGSLQLELVISRCPSTIQMLLEKAAAFSC